MMIWKGGILNQVYEGIKDNFELIEKLLTKFDNWLDLAVKNADDLGKLYP